MLNKFVLPQRKNLQNRSFRGQNLANFDFSYANLRGCDFSGASLHQANFYGAQFGRSRRQWLTLILAVAIAIYVSGDAVFRLIFSALGQPLMGAAGTLVIVLHTTLMLMSLTGLGVQHWPQTAYRSGLTLAGALLGFFYIGSWFGEQLISAVMGSLLWAGGAYFLSYRWRSALSKVIFTTIIFTISNGTVFLLGTTAIAGLAVFHRYGGLFLGLTWFYGWLTWRWGGVWEQMMRAFGGTSFQNADLTDAHFAQIEWGKTSFSGAIAPPAQPEFRNSFSS